MDPCGPYTQPKESVDHLGNIFAHMVSDPPYNPEGKTKKKDPRNTKYLWNNTSGMGMIVSEYSCENVKDKEGLSTMQRIPNVHTLQSFIFFLKEKHSPFHKCHAIDSLDD